jgi:hypothetical protein
LRDVLVQARTAGVMQRAPAAAALWHKLYARLADDEAPGLADPLTSRAEAHITRLSLIYALLDGAAWIEPCHLEAAWEIWRHVRWTIQYVWVGPGTGDPDLDRIAEVIGGGEELDMRQLDRMFSGNRSTRQLRQLAVASGVADEVRIEGRSSGRPRIVLRATEQTEQRKRDEWWTSPTFRLT